MIKKSLKLISQLLSPVHQLFKKFIYSLGNTQLCYAYESGQLYFYWVICWLLCRLLRSITLPSLSIIWGEYSFFTHIFLVFILLLISILVALIPTLVLGKNLRLSIKLTLTHLRLLQTTVFREFVMQLSYIIRWLKYSKKRSVLFLCCLGINFLLIIFSSNVFFLLVWLCFIYSISYYQRVVKKILPKSELNSTKYYQRGKIKKVRFQEYYMRYFKEKPY